MVRGAKYGRFEYGILGGGTVHEKAEILDRPGVLELEIGSFVFAPHFGDCWLS